MIYALLPWRKAQQRPQQSQQSLGRRLFLYVLAATGLGLGCTSYLFYHRLEQQATDEIRQNLRTQVSETETSLVQVERVADNLAIAISAFQRQGIQDPESYKRLTFDFYQRRPDISLAVGFGQTPFGVVPSRQYYWPYYSAYHPKSPGKRMSAPHDDTAYAELFQDDHYQDQDYYLPVAKTGKAMWIEPYDWFGTTMTTFLVPIVGPNQKLAGMTGLDVNVTEIGNRINRPVLPRGGTFAILSSKGNLLAYPENPDRARALATYQDIPALKSLWPRLQAHPEGFFQADGYYWAFEKIRGTDWIMLAKVPTSVVTLPVLLDTLSGAAAATAVLAIVVGWFAARLNRRLRPIVEECQQRIVQDQPVAGAETAAMAAGDEIDLLARSFAQMTLQVQAAIDSLEERVQVRTQELSTTLTQLQQSQVQLVQREKMSALGELVAGVAHEINNPMGFLAGNISPALIYIENLLALIDCYEQTSPPSEVVAAKIEEIDLSFVRQDLPKLIGSMQLGVERIAAISDSLRTFSRADSDRPVQFNLHEGLDSTVLILKHRLKPSQTRPEIQIIRDYGDLPSVACYAGQLNQVFMNIMANAIDAMEKANQGKSYADIVQNSNCLTIRTRADRARNTVTLTFADNGSGMPPAVQARIFEHLFTTKEVGKGTGLGLAIAHQIVTLKHQGTITVDSTPGLGTKFVITLPIGEP
jgi:two-component system, NtrC family, sensor kinase